MVYHMIISAGTVYMSPCLQTTVNIRKALSHGIMRGKGQNAVSAKCYFTGKVNRAQLAPNDGTHTFTMRVTYVSRAQEGLSIDPFMRQ